MHQPLKPYGMKALSLSYVEFEANRKSCHRSSDRYIVIQVSKYLASPSCMYELHRRAV